MIRGFGSNHRCFARQSSALTTWPLARLFSVQNMNSDLYSEDREIRELLGNLTSVKELRRSSIQGKVREFDKSFKYIRKRERVCSFTF